MPLQRESLQHSARRATCKETERLRDIAALARNSAFTQSKENLGADLIALYKALGGGCWEVAPP